MGEKKGWRDDENVVGATPSTVCGGRKGNREKGKNKNKKKWGRLVCGCWVAGKRKK